MKLKVGNRNTKFKTLHPKGGMHTIAQRFDGLDFDGYGVDLRFFETQIVDTGEVLNVSELSVGDIYGINILESHASLLLQTFIRLADKVELVGFRTRLAPKIPRTVIFHNRNNEFQMIDLARKG